MESNYHFGNEIYLDNNATTPPLAEVREEVLRVLSDEFGNPSSAHSTGERARRFLKIARDNVAQLIGGKPENLLFTSSGTEANNFVFYSCTNNAKKKSRIITTQIEHSSIRKMCSYLEINDMEIVYLSVDSKGYVKLDELREALEDETCLVSIQWVNNEIGVIQKLNEILEICNERGVLFHTDAAQAVGKLDFKVDDLPIDFFTFAGHKFHSPQGVGGIYVKDKFQLHPFLFGGFQEEGFRPGTENLPGIVGMGKAAEIRFKNLDETIAYLTELRDMFEAKILDFIPGTRVNGDIANRVCNTTNIMFKDIDGRMLVERIDNRGIRCSQSSACTNFMVEPSYVLRAMGLSDEDAYSSVRFSFGVENTFEEVDKAVEVIREECEILKN